MAVTADKCLSSCRSITCAAATVGTTRCESKPGFCPSGGHCCEVYYIIGGRENSLRLNCSGRCCTHLHRLALISHVHHTPASTRMPALLPCADTHQRLPHPNSLYAHTHATTKSPSTHATSIIVRGCMPDLRPRRVPDVRRCEAGAGVCGAEGHRC